MKSNTPLYVVIGILVIILIATNITDVDVNTVRGDLNNMSAQLTAQAAATATEAPATDAPAATVSSTVTFAPTATIEAPTQASAAQPQGCHVIHESVLVESMDHVSTSGDFIHVEYWFDGQPERETILDAAKADGGAYTFSQPLKGWIWEYDGCTYDEVLAQVNANITRRLAGHFNNVGYFPYGATLSETDKNAPWDPTKLFVPAH